MPVGEQEDTPTTTRLELQSYYLYYVGNNGLSGFNFGPSQFQNLLFLAGYNPGTVPCSTGRCVLPYVGKIRDINSIVLLTNGISFVIQAILFLFIGADRFLRWYLAPLCFTFEQRRPGLNLPPGATLLTIGFTQAYVAFRECRKLKQTLLYLTFYFLMGDVLNTTVTVIATLQNGVVQYSTLDLTLLLIVGIAAQGLGIHLFWITQRHFKISTKAMLSFNVFWIIALTAWGLIGVHTDRFGFKLVWEIWVYQVFYGLLVCPWYAYSQTMISEVSPPPQMFLFFALFSVIGKHSAFIGPLVTSAIITASGNNDNMAFTFLFGLGVFSTIFLWMTKAELSARNLWSLRAGGKGSR